MNKLSPKAQGLRDAVEAVANAVAAAELANKIQDMCFAALNEANVDMATSLYARALVARSNVLTAAHWWADVSRAPLPETYAAIMHLVDQPSVAIVQRVTREGREL